MLKKKPFSKIRLGVGGKKFSEVVADTYAKSFSHKFFVLKKRTRKLLSWKLVRHGLYVAPKAVILNKFDGVAKVDNIIFLVSKEYGFVTDYQIELVRRILKRNISKYSVLIKRIIPFIRITKRSNQVRMGGGKNGKLRFLTFPVYPGCVLFEIRGISFKWLRNILVLILRKLAFKTSLISLRNF